MVNKTRYKNMNTNLESQAQKSKVWIKKHPVLFSIISILFIWSVVSSFNRSNNEVRTDTPQSFKVGSTEFSYLGVDESSAFVEQPEESQVIAKINVNSFFSSESLLRDTGETAGATFQTLFSTYPNINYAVVHYYSDIVDKYGNAENDVILSYSIDKETYQKIVWSNFDSTTMCEFLRSESSLNDGNSVCSILVDLK